jgi:Kef-type K+ transport system membrane component KefB
MYKIFSNAPGKLFMSYFLEHLVAEFQLPFHNPVLIFSLILFIILLSPIILGKLNIPGIIGLILSGILIGPKGFSIIERTSAIDLFSTIGLLYIMFIAGLELDLNEFKTHRKKSIVFGFFTFILPLVLGFPVCYFFLGYDFNASILTASMFATHTLVAYPIVSKLGVSKNQAVAVTVGGTILTDTAVLLILAIIMGNARGSLNFDFWLKMSVSLVLFSAIMFVVIPRISKWFFQKLESEKHAHYIYVLSVVFFAAFLSEAAGVEPIIGAFAAGLALNRLIPQSSPLMNRIEFIGNSLFIPFFLISVGMLVDLSVIFSGAQTWIVAGALVIATLAGKWLAAFFTKSIFKFSKEQGQLIFGLSSAHAAATLAIILVGFNAGILDENILNGTILLILITCVASSIVTEKAAKKIISTQDTAGQLSSSLVYNENILVPVVNIASLEKLLEFAILLKDKKSTNPITMLTVVPNNEQAELNIMESRKKLQKFVHQAAATEIQVETIAAIDHNPASGIARTSRELMSDIIIIGWPGKTGIIEKITGDKVDSMINKIDKNLFICRIDKSLISHEKIVVLIPPLAEKESGFGLWFEKLSLISRELGIPLHFHLDRVTHEAVKMEMKHQAILPEIHFHYFVGWEHFGNIEKIINPTDLIVLISTRKWSVSYLSVLERIPAKLETHFEDSNMIVIYPRQGI